MGKNGMSHYIDYTTKCEVMFIDTSTIGIFFHNPVRPLERHKSGETFVGVFYIFSDNLLVQDCNENNSFF